MGGRLYGGEGDYMDMEKFMGRGGWATMKHGASMGGPIGDNKTTGT